MNFNPLSQPEEGDWFQLAPMVDIVFTLLSFFIMATQLKLDEVDLGMGYRHQAAGLAQASVDLPTSIPVQLRRTPAGVGISVGRAQLKDNDFDGLRNKLAEINMPQLEVIVAGDPTLTVEQVARGLDAVLASPMKRLSLARLTTTGDREDQR